MKEGTAARAVIERFMGFRAEGFVARAIFKLVAEKDAVLPPFTSRVLRASLFRAECLEPLARLYSSRPSMRPVTLRVLRDPEGRPLYRRYGERGVFRVRRGEVLRGEIAYYARGAEAFEPAMCDGAEVDIDYFRYVIEMEEVEVRSVEDLGERLAEAESVKLRIKTPLTVPAKLKVPSAIARSVGAGVNVYRLLPTPGYLLGQAARQWASIVVGLDPAKALKEARLVAMVAEAAVREVDFRLRPETAIYGKDPSGILRLVRGVTGTIALEYVEPELISGLAGALLEFASYMGLGKSRSIGFGEVEVLP